MIQIFYDRALVKTTCLLAELPILTSAPVNKIQQLSTSKTGPIWMWFNRKYLVFPLKAGPSEEHISTDIRQDSPVNWSDLLGQLSLLNSKHTEVQKIISWEHKINQGSLCRHRLRSLYCLSETSEQANTKDVPSPFHPSSVIPWGLFFISGLFIPLAQYAIKQSWVCVLSQSDIFVDLAGLIKTFCFLRDAVVVGNPGLLDNPSGTISGDCLHSVCDHKG